MKKARALTIGLTGGIGSGKSTVAARCAALGAWVVDTDAIARALTAPAGLALPAIVAAFGPEMVGVDGAMDRARMRALVFERPEARQQLEAILHPMIGQQTAKQAALAAAGQSIVFDVPLLTESARWRQQVDRVLVVDCAEQLQIERVQARNGWPEAQVRQVLTQQASRSARRAIADAVIVNEGASLEALHRAVDALWRDWHADAPVTGVAV